MCTRLSRRPDVRFLALLVGLLLLSARPFVGWSVAQEGSVDTSGIATEVHIDDEGVQVHKKGGTSGRQIRITTKGQGGEVPTPPIPPDIDITVGEDSNANDIVRFGSDITIHPGKKIDGSVVAIGGDITVLGEVMEDVVSIGGNVDVKPSGVIHGDAVAVGGNVNEEVGSTINGENVSIGFSALKLLGLFGLLAGIGSFGAAIGLLLVLVMVGVIALILARTRMEAMLSSYDSHMGKFFLNGFLCTLAFGPLFILLLITIIGIPVAILLPFAYALGGLVGIACSGMYLGRRLRPGSSRGWSAVIGLGVLVLVQWFGGWMSDTGWLRVFGWVLSLIAFVGWMWAGFTGLGAIWVTRFGDPKRVARLRGDIPPASQGGEGSTAVAVPAEPATTWEVPSVSPPEPQVIPPPTPPAPDPT